MMNILARLDRSTTLLKFLHHANLSMASAEWSHYQIKGRNVPGPDLPGKVRPRTSARYCLYVEATRKNLKMPDLPVPCAGLLVHTPSIAQFECYLSFERPSVSPFRAHQASYLY